MKAALAKKRLPRYTISESSMDMSETSLAVPSDLEQSKSEENVTESLENLELELSASQSVISLETQDLNTILSPTSFRHSSSVSTIGSSHLTIDDSETSGYTTESIYRSSPESSYTLTGSSYNSFQINFGPPLGNFLREIHIGINANATCEQIEGICWDLRRLLTNEIAFIHQAGDFRPAIYLIAYHYM
ncbi:uncharacterized protein Dwil_GK19374 [Drosophila willistoni]|uniref:Uncharacterized protein n=2 Tax=Drosophila willistoni TaxID=7260 RepID=B4N184_DROWI|nr:uncharacterized protein Dwil_GK19374 [Drosophila willistoni]